MKRVACTSPDVTIGYKKMKRAKTSSLKASNSGVPVAATKKQKIDPKPTQSADACQSPNKTVKTSPVVANPQIEQLTQPKQNSSSVREWSSFIDPKTLSSTPPSAFLNFAQIEGPRMQEGNPSLTYEQIRLKLPQMWNSLDLDKQRVYGSEVGYLQLNVNVRSIYSGSDSDSDSYSESSSASEQDELEVMKKSRSKSKDVTTSHGQMNPGKTSPVEASNSHVQVVPTKKRKIETKRTESPNACQSPNKMVKTSPVVVSPQIEQMIEPKQSSSPLRECSPCSEPKTLSPVPPLAIEKSAQIGGPGMEDGYSFLRPDDLVFSLPQLWSWVDLNGQKVYGSEVEDSQLSNLSLRSIDHISDSDNSVPSPASEQDEGNCGSQIAPDDRSQDGPTSPSLTEYPLPNDHDLDEGNCESQVSANAEDKSLDGPSSLDLKEHHPHPLLIDLIVNKTLKFVSPSHLLVCRLVCKQWNKVAIPLIRSHYEVTIYGTARKLNSNRTIHNFIEDMFKYHYSGIPFPSTNFKLGSFYAKDLLGRRFINVFGYSATGYDLSATGEEHMVENVAELLRSCPRLESFVMPCQLTSHFGFGNPIRLFDANEKPDLRSVKKFSLGARENPVGRKKNCPTFFEEFFKAAVNVSSFDLRDSIEPVEGVVPTQGMNNTSLEVLKILDKLKESKIKSLAFSEVSQNIIELLNKMAEKGLELKALVMSSVKLELVKLFRDTLISLRTTRQFKLSLSEFPKLPRLTVLDMKITRNTKLNLYEVNNSFPILDTLALHCDSVDRNTVQGTFDDEDGIEIECSQNLKMRTLSLLGISVRSQTFQEMLYGFPNLVALELDIYVDGDKILPIIWTQMTGLKKLNLSGTLRLPLGINIDSVITGISYNFNPEIIQKQLRVLKLMTPGIRKDTISKLTRELRTQPSISDLKNLRYLRLSLTDECALRLRMGEARMTDFTGYLGLYSLKHLEHLFIRHCDFSATCAEMLVKDIGIETWIIRRHDIIPSDPDVSESKFPTTFMSSSSQD